MKAGKISQDNEIAAPASSVWKIYRGFDLPRFVNQHLSNVLGTVDFIQGDGGVGSVVRLTYPPGSPGIGYLTERFTIMDDEKCIKETEQIAGGYLALGFSCIRMRFEIFEKDRESTVIRATVEYEIDEKLKENVSFISLQVLQTVAETVEKHLVGDKASA